MINLVMVGVDKWREYTLPYIQSVQSNEPDCRIICVDNGSIEPYPDVKNVLMIRTERLSYAAALNMGIAFGKPADWYLVGNNDIICNKPFARKVHDLHPKTLYGFAEYTGVVARGVRYLSGWLMIISEYVLDRVGLFDENYAPMYFEDADYSYRATENNIPLVCLERKEFGFRHLEDERQGERVDFMKNNMEFRHKNRTYFQEKHGL